MDSAWRVIERLSADDHSFILFCLVMLAGCVVRTIAIVITRTYRLVMVAARGWPPAHLDADGDWKPEEEKEAETTNA